MSWTTTRHGLRRLRLPFASGVTTIGAVHLVNSHWFEITPINGNSMFPTLSPDFNETGRRDFIIWRKWDPNNGLQRGDLVMYRSPYQPETTVVKRVTALGGDTVTLDPNRMPPDEFKADKWASYAGQVVVPYGHAWVEGDNKDSSLDSNDFGPISRSMIIGRGWKAILPVSIAFTRPWDDFKSKTKVKTGQETLPGEWRDV